MKKILLSCVAALAGSMSANAQTYTPVEISSGFNMDVICENKDNVAGTTSQFDEQELQGIDGGGFVYYTSDANAEGALCGADGNFTTTARNVAYHVNVSSTGVVNNALVLKAGKAASGIGEGTLVFKNNVKGKSIYVVGTSADGNSNVQVTVNYADNTTIVDNITIGNWDTKNIGEVKTGLGRMASKECWAGDAGTIQGGYNFELFESAVNTDVNKEIKSVTIKRTNTGTCCAIFAVSISNDVVQPTAVESVQSVQTPAESYYSLDGQLLQTPQKGINIVKYKNNTFKKIIVK